MTNVHGTFCDECGLILAHTAPRIKWNEKDFHDGCFPKWRWKHDMEKREELVRHMRQKLFLLKARRI